MPNYLIAHYQGHFRQTSRSHSVYYGLTLSSCPTLTKKFKQFTGQKAPLLTGQLKFYLFNDRLRFISSLQKESVYCWTYVKKGKYFHLQDWTLLGDQRTISRSWNCLLKNNHSND